MVEKISQRAFARTAGVSAAAVRKALTAGRLVQDDDLCLDLKEDGNEFFVQEHQRQAVEKMEETGEVLPGWAAMCLPQQGRAPLPIFFIPPYGKGNFVSSTDFFDDWSFTDEPMAAFDPKGKRHKLTLVYDKKSPPPWLREARKADGAAPKKGRPARASR